jgi:hypothetical protein
MGKHKDLTGLKFGRLLVKEISPTKSKGNRIMWICECDCGKITKVTAKDLLNGNTKSCGCYAQEMRGKSLKKNTIFNLDGEYGIGYVGDSQFYFDLEDYELIKDYYWVIHNGYVATRKFYKNKTEKIYMHRLILGLSAKDDFMVDHEDHNKLNNRKNNIRIVTCAENNFNTKLNIKNKSGIIGVYYKEKIWEARLQKNKKLVLLGRYKTIEDAIIARLKAEKEYFGEFAPQKDLFKKYGI